MDATERELRERNADLLVAIYEWMEYHNYFSKDPPRDSVDEKLVAAWYGPEEPTE